MSKHMTLKHPDNYQSHYSKGKKLNIALAAEMRKHPVQMFGTGESF